jgi:hypothetical protein
LWCLVRPDFCWVVVVVLVAGDGGHGDAVGEGFPGFVVSAATVRAAFDVDGLSVDGCGVAVLVGSGEVVEGVGGDVGAGVSVDGVDPDFVVADEDFYGVVGLPVGVGDFGWVEVGLDVDGFLGGILCLLDGHGFSVGVVGGFVWGFWGGVLVVVGQRFSPVVGAGGKPVVRPVPKRVVARKPPVVKPKPKVVPVRPKVKPKSPGVLVGVTDYGKKVYAKPGVGVPPKPVVKGPKPGGRWGRGNNFDPGIGVKTGKKVPARLVSPRGPTKNVRT